MSTSLNKVMIIGTLGRDPEARASQNGGEIVTLSVATSETWKDKTTREKKEKTKWHRVVIFNDGLARVAKDYLQKGSKVYIEGQLQTRKWTDKDGAEKYSTEIVLQQFGAQMIMLSNKQAAPIDDYAVPNEYSVKTKEHVLDDEILF
jgi:single-strand DNA-binding protein